HRRCTAEGGGRRRDASAKGDAGNGEAVDGEGAEDVGEDTRQRRQAVWRGGAGAPYGVRGAEALVREGRGSVGAEEGEGTVGSAGAAADGEGAPGRGRDLRRARLDRKSTRLNSSHT